MSEEIVSTNMCSQNCPCHDTGFTSWQNNPKVLYEMVDEKTLNAFGRTNLNNSPATAELSPLTWTTDLQSGFNSFMQCYQHWQDKKQRDPSLNLTDIFRLRTKRYRNSVGQPFRGTDERIEWDEGLDFFLTHQGEFDLYQILEDDYNCSGMCRPGPVIQNIMEILTIVVVVEVVLPQLAVTPMVLHLSQLVGKLEIVEQVMVVMVLLQQ